MALKKRTAVVLLVVFAFGVFSMHLSHFGTHKPENMEAVTIKRQTSSVVTETDEQFWKRMTQRMRERRLQMKKACQKLGLSNGEKNEIQVVISKKYKLAYCPVAKTGCSNVKRVMLALNGYGNDSGKIFPQNVLGENQHVHEETRKYTEKGFGMPPIVRNNSYTKFLVVRHPYERVFSAFKNKIELRPDGFLPQYFKISHAISKNYSDGFSGPNSTATFGQFVDYLHQTNNTIFNGFSNHWNSANVICQPCENDYDVIIKVETMQDDFRYLMKLINASHVKVPKGYSKEGGSRVNVQSAFNAIKNMSNLRQQHLRHVYQADFLLFGYNPDL